MKDEELKIQEKKLPAAPEKPTAPDKETTPPFFVEAEKLFDKVSEISKQVAAQAYDFFRERGGRFGRDIEDWLDAESRVLRFVPIEITERDGTINVTAAVPGFKPEEIEISVDGATLMISGETHAMEHLEDENVLHSDFYSDRFFRHIPLPSPVNVDEAKANMVHGMLKISLPKAAAAEPKRVAVAAG